jgi:NAD+ kinase
VTADAAPGRESAPGRRLPPRVVGVVGHPGHAGLHDTLRSLLLHASAAGWQVLLEKDLLDLAGRGDRLDDDALESLDLLVTLGGDGTLLRGARMVAPLGVPVLGINLGHLGFLTSFAPQDMDAAFPHLVSGDVRIERRMVLSARAETADGLLRGEYLALNDAVLHKGGFARVIRIAVRADGQEVGTYRADGIILSTPTGSTAYSLSANGPIVSPALDCIIATPICPHTLAVRPLVLPAEERVTVEILDTSEELILTIDGQEGAALAPGDRLVVRRADVPLCLVRLPGQTFFDTLRRKLRWGDVASPGER